MHKLLRRGKILALLLCALALPAQARVVEGLYEVMEPVSSRGATDRSAAESRGLERVFVRVTGDADIGSNPRLESVLERARQFVQGYRYVTEDNQLYLSFSFDPRAVSEQVRKLALPVWPSNRPGTLVWVAVDRLREGRSALSEQSAPELFTAMQAMAMERGLPVDFPVMDASDQRNMPLGNLWAQDESAAQRAGVRYRTDATLMGRLLEVSENRWQGDWLLIHGGRSYAFDARGDSLQAVALRGIDEAADLLAQRYTVRAGAANGQQNAVVVELSGIDSFADYTDASAYLSGLALVSRADLLSVDGDRMRVALTTASPLRSLRDALALNRKLHAGAEQDPIDLSGYRAPQGSAENPLRYRWN